VKPRSAALCLAVGTLVALPLAAESGLPPDMEKARESCRKEHEWPKLPPSVEGCDVDWDDPTSVEASVVLPVRLRGPSRKPPSLPAGEEVRAATLVLEYLISAEGDVTDVCVLRSVSPTVDKFFVDSAKESKYSPGTVCGKAVDFSWIVTVNHHAWNWKREPVEETPPNSLDRSP